MKTPDDPIEKLLGAPYDSLDELTKKIARHVSDRKHIARNTAKELDEKSTLGERAADAVATFGGSWTFITLIMLNLKAELEIMLLHEKVDLLRKSQWSELLAIQKEQLKRLDNLIEKKTMSE